MSKPTAPPPFVTVYDKGHAARPHGLGAGTRVVPLRNLGREGGTWLHHFVEHYDDLAEWTYLAQGEPHQDPAEFRRRLEVEYPDTTSLTREYLPDFPPRWVKDRDVVEWHGGVEVRYGRAVHQGGRTRAETEPWLRRAWAHFFACPPPDPIEEWTYGYGAQYAVPRRRILGRPRAYWAWCLDVIGRPEHAGPAHEHSWGSGYAFEVLWRYLLGDAARWPARLDQLDRPAMAARAEFCRFGSGPCGCGAEARACSHLMQVGRVWRSTHCLDCPFKEIGTGGL